MGFLGNLLRLLLLLSTMFLATTGVMACSCETYNQPRPDAREYYRKKFHGAIFTGTIQAVRNEPEGSAGITTTELTVEVDEYWAGVTKPFLTILSVGAESCGLEWRIGKKAFFIAEKYDGQLYESMCERANWGGQYPEAKWTSYTLKVLGRAKRFPKSN